MHIIIRILEHCILRLIIDPFIEYSMYHKSDSTRITLKSDDLLKTIISYHFFSWLLLFTFYCEDNSNHCIKAHNTILIVEWNRHKNYLTS